MRTSLVVLGMHHSGSGTLASTLVRVAPGGEVHSGPKLRSICERLLRAVDADWWKVADFTIQSLPHELLRRQRNELRDLLVDGGADGITVIEEPRLCLLFPALRPAMAVSACIHVYRNPVAVARVLRAEEGLSISEGLALWEAYNAAALHASAGLPRILVSYEALVAEPRACIKKLTLELAELGVQCPANPADAHLEGLPAPYLEDGGSSLRTEHFLTSSQDALWRGLRSGQAVRAWGHACPPPGHIEVLRDLESRRRAFGRLKQELEAQRAARQALERTLAARTAQVAKLKSEAKEDKGEISILKQRVESLDALMSEMHASRSWRITAPLRSITVAAQGVRSAVREHAQGGGWCQGARSMIGEWLRRIHPTHEARARSDLPLANGAEETFVLYRIIGNDLYPRHKKGQAIENLGFILKHEPVLPGCEKRFILNRLVDPDQERAMVALLEESGCAYVRIPFDPNEYAQIGFDTDILPAPGFLAGEGIGLLDDAAKGRLLAAVYRLKNNYVMNNNGARNTALQDGRRRAKWILPWDGNCFLTQEAWSAIRTDIAQAPLNRYFVVPMARMLDNRPLVAGGDIPKAVEEPQVIFRADAAEQFNTAFCYGCRPKVELLWRLGVKGPWDKYLDDPWDQERRSLSPEAGLVGRAGWVARLSSGMNALEANSDRAALHRGLVRTGAIVTTLRNLDVRLAGIDSEQPASIRMRVLQQEVESQDSPRLGGVVDSLLRAANVALERSSEGAACFGLQQVLDDSMVLALACSFTGERRLGDAGAGSLKRLLESHVHHDNPEAPGESGILDMYCYLDAVRLLERAGSIPEPVGSAFRTWLRTQLDWLLTSPGGLQQRARADYHGTCYDLQVAAIASFLDDPEVVYAALIRAQARIGEQFAPDGSQPAELEGAAAAHRCSLNFQSWLNLAELASHWGVDLWRHRARSGAGLVQGARWLLSRMGGVWPYEQIEDFDAERLHPIRFAAREFTDELGSGRHPDSPYGCKSVFAPPTGIRPFWNLGSYGQPKVTKRSDRAGEY